MLCSLSSPELNLATQLFLIVMMQLHQNPRRSAYSLVESRCMYSEPSRSVGHGLSTCKLPIQAHTHTHTHGQDPSSPATPASSSNRLVTGLHTDAIRGMERLKAGNLSHRCEAQ